MVVRVNIFQTESLTENNGRSPEKVIRKYLSRAFDKSNLDSDIRIGFDSVSVSTQDSLCDEGSSYHEWFDIVEEGFVSVAKDSNLLLTDNDGNGCGSVGGNVSVAGVNRITNDIEYTESGQGNVYDDIETAMHEVAHNLGFSHDGDDDKPGKQHLGMAWNEPVTFLGFNLSWLFGGAWHRTPCVTDTDTSNLCGESVPEKKFDTVEHELYYHTCAIERFDVVDRKS